MRQGLYDFRLFRRKTGQRQSRSIYRPCDQSGNKQKLDRIGHEYIPFKKQLYAK